MFRGVFFYEGSSEDFLYLFFSLLFRYICSYIVIANLVLMLIYIYIYILRLLLQFHLSLHMLFLFSLYVHASYILYAIFYFYFILKCRDEFYLKCFRNISCQSLLVTNSFLAKFFKSFC